MEYGSKVKKYTDKLEDQRSMEANKKLKCYYIMKINPKAFTIPIMTTIKSA